jgi:hypothetical protein
MMSHYDSDGRADLFGPIPPASERSGSLTGSITASNMTRSVPIRAGNITVADEDDRDLKLESQHDREWHSTLVRMLSMLDYARSSFEVAESERDPISAVRIAATITHQVADFIAANVQEQENSLAVSEALGAATRFLSATKVAAATAPKKKYFGLFGSVPADRGRVDECMWVLRDLPLVLERYFALLGSAFRNQSLRVDWIETSGTFIVELKQTLQWVDGFQANRSSTQLRVR